MQAVVLAAGRSSRFYPYNSQNKSFVRLFGKTILEHTLSGIRDSGIQDILIVVSDKKFAEVTLSDSIKKDLDIKLIEQKEALGMGDALLKCREFIEDDFFLLHATHVDFNEYYSEMEGKNKGEVLLLAKKEEKTGKYAVLEVEGDRIISLTEKPKEDPSGLRVIGIYLLSKSFLESLEKTPSEHYSLERAIAQFCETHSVYFVQTDKESVSLKFPWDLLKLKDYLLSKLIPHISDKAEISQNAIVDKKAIIENNAKILEGACIKGKAYIGKNSVIGNNAIVRNDCVIGENCVIGAFTEIKNSIVMDGTKIHSGFIGDSILGENNRIAGDFSAANRRLDRKNIKIKIKDQEYDAGTSSFGLISGSNVNIGVKAVTMPGVVIGNNVVVGPRTTVMKNLADNTRFYTEFKEVVEKKINGRLKDREKFVLFDIDYTLFDTKSFMDTNLNSYKNYEEVEEVLNEIAKVAKLGIYSKGDAIFQNDKLIKTGILKHFLKKNIHILADKGEVMKKVLDNYSNKQLFLVDDKIKILEMAKKLNPSAHTIWVKRGPFVEIMKTIKYEPDTTVETLEAIIPVIQEED